MKMSTKGRYGLRAVIDIAANTGGEPVSARCIAERARISEGYLLQLLRHLKDAGIVYSVRGASGGYTLAKPSSEITVGEIFRAVGEPVKPVECAGITEGAFCEDARTCRAKNAWSRLNAGIAQILDNITIASLFEAKEELETAGSDP